MGYGGTVTDSFWDIETSGQIASKGGSGKLTVEMQTAATFLKAGWDFVDEIDNGTEDVWWIDDGNDYPRLAWENQPGTAIIHPGLSAILTGAGTQNDSYLIYTAQDLITIGFSVRIILKSAVNGFVPPPGSS